MLKFLIISSNTHFAIEVIFFTARSQVNARKLNKVQISLQFKLH